MSAVKPYSVQVMREAYIRHSNFPAADTTSFFNAETKKISSEPVSNSAKTTTFYRNIFKFKEKIFPVPARRPSSCDNTFCGELEPARNPKDKATLAEAQPFRKSVPGRPTGSGNDTTVSRCESQTT
ncbi:hypothetical protein JWJ88_12550 (plasmid) [Paracoccus methylovorus]|uniref:Uncharacterized protein n=2 Tax=Paracoccus TaxID=265 RepID=A0ABX7JKH4_9RHOB|nr:MULTISPECIES: hypothetical protein [Paracoccus]QRZ14314.1 hypothetical protein JWJ88_12550 [Paracoccus methylovorus]